MLRITLVIAVCLLQISISLDHEILLAQDESGLEEQAPPGVLANEPQTVEEHFDAVLLMLRVSRPDLAQRYLTAMLEMQPDDETLLRLRDIHGTAAFLQLSRNPDLLPQARELLDRVQAAATNQFADPAYFDGLLARLQGEPRDREAAVSDLKHYGADAVPELLARLGGANGGDRDLLLYTLVSFGPVAIDPLLGALEAPDPGLRATAIEALGWIGNEAIVPRLWYPALAADESPQAQRAALRAIARIRLGDPDLTDRLDPVGAADEVFQRALVHFRGEYDWIPGPEGAIDLWTWDAQQNRLVKAATNPTAASMLMAERLARQAMLMAPERELHRALFLAAALAHSRYRAGWDQPLPEGPGTAHDLALFSGADLTEFALGLAVEHRNAAAAVGAVTALGKIGTRDQLRQRGERPLAIIAALDFPNDRVQFAAATAVLQIGPTESFPRSSRVIDILARSLRTEGGPRGVVIDPNTTRATDTASVLGRLGYNTSIARTGREGFCEAAKQGDVALAVLHPNTIRWELTQTIANLRADSRTAGIPIVIAAPEPARADMLRVLRRVPDSGFVATDGEAAHWMQQLQPVLAELSAPPLTSQQQDERRHAAAYWLRHIAQSTQANLFDLTQAEEALSQAASEPVIGHDAIIALGAIARPSVQQRLVDLIVAPAIDEDLREAAARQLAFHVRRHGRLLTDSSVTALIDAWSSTPEPAVRSSLSADIGTLEPTPEAVFEKLRDYPLPALRQP